MKKPITFLTAALLIASCGASEEAVTDFAAATPEESGRRNFRVCASCHAVSNPANGNSPRLIGPNLWGIVGSPAASDKTFAYSAALREADIIWTEENLSLYIENPQGFIKGNRMSFVGERSPERRTEIINYLKTLN